MRRILVLLMALVMSFTTMAYAEEKPLIALGDYGPEVIELHQKLIKLGLLEIRPESPYGPESEEAVRLLQSVLEVEETGTVRDQDELNLLISTESSQLPSQDELNILKARARIMENLLLGVEYSEGASSFNDKSFIFTTDLVGNSFNMVALQLFDENNEFIENIYSGAEGFVVGDYHFSHESGKYVIHC